uniref:PS II complex 12 kDa extrinsic protein n=1 Tax=Trieres chinensis TaxID=1514140 RepID=A0A7S2ETX9_TRICV|mmetsp:Transcript_39420/g.80422  ORF Transcript_39420/g.80422 Transcript_39420/m.80422 type:complete len:121 (+) Transcript_39420:115-477(+)|eukprot:CAMPEP_0183306990 /NCGR_PEP_ID=MMETSP0160_2-20130417/15335_1 /TAXON_ID=2839 ORGANISM="Odontella Sinensis, Strain Grunow 1884" /NCGR_SAMPLE_ID=MMETSP0160_2 /ASSEMBLY_ACC=CAM_ASM_000250 /LENGTH=120 /DNA_ID=CAMNT_0025470479 /DNA_START=97 /DNA_END=459 /DNA_ORIENTATION=-
MSRASLFVAATVVASASSVAAFAPSLKLDVNPSRTENVGLAAENNFFNNLFGGAPKVKKIKYKGRLYPTGGTIEDVVLPGAIDEKTIATLEKTLEKSVATEDSPAEKADKLWYFANVVEE